MKTIERLLEGLEFGLRVDHADFFCIGSDDDRFTIHMKELSGEAHLNISVRAHEFKDEILVFPAQLVSLHNFGVDMLHVVGLVDGLYRAIPRALQVNPKGTCKYTIKGLEHLNDQ